MICEPQAIKLPVTDLSDIPNAERRARAREIALQESRKTYVMFSPMLRPLLLRLGEAEHWLVLITNEIACDTRSVRVLVDELAALYEGEVRGCAVSLPPLPMRYAEAMAGCTLPPQTEAELRRYWKKRLEGAPALLELPTDFPRPPHQSDEGAREPVSVTREAAEALEKLGRQEGCTPFMTLMAVFQTLLSRYSSSTDILVGSTIENRFREEMRGIVGNFDNLLVFRSDASGDPTFREFLRRVREVVASGLAAKALPFELVLEEVQPERNASYTPVCQVLLEFDDQPAGGRDAGGLQMVPVQLDNRTAKLDLKLHLTRTDEGLSGWIEYSTAIFARDRIARMIEHFGELARAAAEDADKALGQLPLMARSETERVLVEWNSTARDYPRTATLPALFENQTRRTPGAVALVAGTERLTYAELNDRANQLAHHLRGIGVGPGVMVGICLERSWRLLVGILGVLKAGGAYVPLDPAYPRERLAFILDDAKAPVLVTQESLRGLHSVAGANVVCLDSDWPRIRGCSRETPESGIQAHDLAYVIYTSGSTGRPKGVALEHRNAAALVHWAKNVFAPEELAGVLASTSVCFDLSVFEMFVPLSWGGTVILAENALALPGLPAAREVTLINTVPSAVRELLRLKGIPASVRIINLAGEPLPTTLVNRIYQETAVQKVYDLYGPTETTTYSTCALRRPDQPATIGRPLDNEQIFLLDSRQQPVPIGIPGEIYIGGAGVARGYLNRPELTAGKFVPNPVRGTPISKSARRGNHFEQEKTERTEDEINGISGSSVTSCSTSDRLYRTGDLARWRADGTLEFLGRMDHQVKIRGFRIELGEVESAFRKHPGLRDFVVIAGEDPGGNKRLAAYVVCHPGKIVSVEELRRFGKERLPEYMVPSVFVFLDALPLTPNGKVNRKALPSPEPEQRKEDKNFLAPRTPMEEQMAAVWREVLHLEQVGVRDNFFELGGHSLLAIQVISRVREVFKVELPLFSLFDAPTIEKLTKGMASREWTQNQLPVLPLRPATHQGDLPVSFVQERLWFLDQLAPGGHAYNVPAALRLKGSLDSGALQKALDEIVRRHEALRTVFRFEDGKLTQHIQPASACELARTDFSGTEQAREEELQSWINRQAQQPFDLAAGPLMRVSLARCDETDHALLVVMHHTVSDGWSLTILFQELEALYAAFAQGKPAPALPELPIQYADYALWKRQWMDGAVLREELHFWSERLKGAPASVTFPVDHADPEISEERADRQWVRFSPEATEAITALSQRENCTPFVVLMAALTLAFEKWTHQQDLVIGTVVAGRNRRELENVIGCFMNFLPIRTRMEGIETGKELMAAIKASVLEAQAHQDCPFEKIVEAVNPERRLNQNPLYNVALLLQNFPAEMFKHPALNVSQMAVETHAALLDLRFEAEFTPQGLALSCEYKSGLFEADTIRQLLASYETLVSALVRKPETRVAELDITPELKKQAEAAREQSSENPVAIAGSFTAEPVEDSLSYWLKELEMPAPVKFAPYNQIFQELLDPASLLNSNSRGANVILLRIQDWLKFSEDHAADGDRSAALPNDTLERTAREFVEAAKSAASRMAAPLLVAICPASPDFASDDDSGRTIRKLETFVATELDKSGGIHVLTPGDLLRLYPVANYYDASGDELGHVPYTPVFFTALGTAIARKLHAIKRPPHKVIVLDCDQTLWSGVCGEDGAKGICVDEPRRALQEFMRAQLDSGRLLAVCSKNSEDDVRQVFAERLDMPLRHEHFAAWRTNWQPKSENIKSIARELNLGLDSFIFVDDNPLECAEVEANCPEVLTLQLPESPADIPAFLNHCWVFDHAKLTEEDRKRGRLYQQNREREQLRSRSMSLADFLAGLELKIEIAPMAESQVQRVSQLTQRTNQFNFTTVRRSEAEVKKLVGHSDVLAVTVRDRFGDYGLVGVLISNTSDTAIEVDTFLLSCRVLGRGVEHEMLARLGAMALERKRRWINVHFYPSDRNKPAFDFLQSVGADFRQAPNGGYVYQFPAEYAAEVTFTPSESVEPERRRKSARATPPRNRNHLLHDL